MANVHSTYVQGSPCDLDWYNYFKNMDQHWDLECTVQFCVPKQCKDSSIHWAMLPAAIATNLQCKNQTTYVGTVGKIDNYNLPVHQLVSMNATDEIDPRCLENKIPSASFSFKVEGISENTPLDTLDTILAGFDDKMVRVYRGFCDHTNPIFDENGRWGLDYYSDFTHDLVCLGNYKIIDRQYNYEKQTIDVSCEHIFFNKFSQDDAYKPIYKNGNTLYTNTLYQRYPYPFSAATVDGGDATHPIKQIRSYKLGYNAYEMTRSTSYAELGENRIPIYGWGFPDTGMRSYGVNTAGYVTGIAANVTALDRVWNVTTDNDLQSVYKTTAPLTRTLDTETTLCQFNNNWKKESALTTLMTWNLMNWIHYVPARPLQKMQEEALDIDDQENADGTWTVVQGKTLSESNFLDKTAAKTYKRSKKGTNGMWFPAIANTPYKVLPSFLLSQTVAKDSIEWEPVQWVKTYYMDLLTIPSKMNVDYYTFQNQTYAASTDDVYKFETSAWQPYPSNQDTGFNIITQQPLKEDTWYLNKSAEINGTNAFLADLFGFDMPATDQMGQVNIPARGDSIVAYKVLWNTNIAGLANRQPLAIGLISRDPTIYAYDINGKLLDDTAIQNTKGIDTIHAYSYYYNLPSRMIQRANNGDLGLKSPMYQLTWTMVDDPSLRVGNVVWVPLQNEYLKVYITKQERSFDGGARLTCTGWAYEKTGQKVYNPTITEGKATYFVNNPDTDPKGEWLKFTWKPGGDYNATDTIIYKFSVTDQYARWSFDIGVAAIMFGDTPEKMFNLPYVSQQIGVDLPTLTGSTVYYRITGYFPPNSQMVYSSAPVTKVAWNNEAFSQLHVGYIRASNEHQPLIVGNPLQG